MTARLDMLRIAFDLAHRAIPVTRFDLLLSQLASAWTAVAPNSPMLVSLVHDGRLSGLFHDGRDHASTGLTAIEIAAPDGWSARVAVDAIPAEPAVTAAMLRRMTVVPFSGEDIPPTAVTGPQAASNVANPGSPILGGVILGAGISAVGVRELASISGRLIAQLSAFTNQKSGTAVTPGSDRKPAGSDLLLSPDRLEALAEFAAGAGHEINNPIATIVGRASLLLKSEVDPERRRALETIGGQAYRVRDMIGDAMTFARPPAPQIAPFLMASAVQHVVDRMQHHLDACGISVTAAIDADAALAADEEQFHVVVACLLRNSIEAIGEGGTISILGCRSTDDGDFCQLTVEDDGPGLSAVERTHLFDPFFSGRQAGRGLGFGLAKCWRIVTANHGLIRVDDARERGLSIATIWPAAATLTQP